MNLSRQTVELLRGERERLATGINGITDQEEAIASTRVRLREMEDRLLETKKALCAIDRDLATWGAEVEVR